MVGSEAEILAGQYHSNIKLDAVLASECAFEARYDLPVVFLPTASSAEVLRIILDQNCVRMNTISMSIAPKAIQDFLDELALDRAEDLIQN